MNFYNDKIKESFGDQPIGDNDMVNERIRTELKNEIDRLFESFGKYGKSDDVKVSRWLDRVMRKKGITINILERVVNNILDDFDRTPSMAQFMNYTEQEMKSNHKKDFYLSENDIKKINEQKSRAAKIKRQFLELYDKEKLTQYVIYWLNKVHKISAPTLKYYGIGVNAFELPALLDWAEAQGNFERAVQRGNKKLERIENNKARGREIYF